MASNCTVLHINASDLNGQLDKFYYIFDFALNSCLLPCICAIGFVANIGVIWILLRSTIWKSLKPYLIMLATWDLLLLCTSCSVFSVISWLSHDILQRNNRFLYIFPVTHMLYNVCFLGHIWTTVALTVERFLAICHVLWHRRVVNHRALSACTLILVLVLSVGLGIPHYFEITIRVCADMSANTDLLFVSQSTLYEMADYQHYFRVAGSLAFSSLCPLIVLVVLTVKITHRMQRGVSIRISGAGDAQRKKRGNRYVVRLRQSQARNLGRANRPLIMILLISICSYILPTAADILEFLSNLDSLRLNTILNYMVGVSNFLVVTNAAVPFFVYLFASRRFRYESRRHILLQALTERPSVSTSRLSPSPSMTRVNSPALLTNYADRSLLYVRNVSYSGGDKSSLQLPTLSSCV